MSQQPQSDPHQRLNIDDTSIQDSHIGQAGRDLTQIQYMNVYDSVNVAGLGGRQASSTVKPLTQEDYRNRKVLLSKVKKFWIEDLLEKSLHTRVLMELGLEERLDAVDRPFRDVQEIPNESRQTLPVGTDITQVFNQMGEGRTLLILGEPGAGKTTILLKLAQNLIASIEKDLCQPIPVVFNLSSWASERQNIADWLVQELNSKYQVSKKVGKAWVDEQQLLLLLDGLDEVKAERRGACIRALNQFIQEHGQTEMLVCSRIRDYEALSARLKLQGAICIQTLTPEQINQYLERAGDQLEAVKTVLQEDTLLQELAESPLALSIMSLAYQGISVEDLPMTGSAEERRQHLFNAYIERMFQRPRTEQRYSKEQVMCWLIWLAQRMEQESQSLFLIEKMQPDWLLNKTKNTNHRLVVYVLVVTPIAILFLGFLFKPLFDLGFESFFKQAFKLNLMYWLVLAGILIISIFIQLIDRFAISKIETVETLSVSIDWIGLVAYLIWGIILGLIVGVICMFIEIISITPMFMPSNSWHDVLINIQSLGSGSGVLVVLFSGIGLGQGLFYGLIQNCELKKSELETKTLPNQGIWRSAMNTGILALSCGSLAGLIGVVVDGSRGLIAGLACGLLIAITEGGSYACFQHFTLRLILYCTGFIPWNYARFLDYAAERIFLQKVGSGYIFIHRLLLEHFAQMELEQVRR